MCEEYLLGIPEPCEYGVAIWRIYQQERDYADFGNRTGNPEESRRKPSRSPLSEGPPAHCNHTNQGKATDQANSPTQRCLSRRCQQNLRLRW